LAVTRREVDPPALWFAVKKRHSYWVSTPATSKQRALRAIDAYGGKTKIERLINTRFATPTMVNYSK
jgi:hypothetical protein